MCENCKKIQDNFNQLIDLLVQMMLYPDRKTITLDTRDTVADQFKALKFEE